MMNRPTTKPVIELTNLVIDKTGSMAKTDYRPSRLAAAKEAALAFIKRKPVIDGRDRTAVLGFAESAFLVSPFGRHPVEARDDMGALSSSGNTCITAGLRMALDHLRAERKRFPGATLRCVLLSDGEHNSGADPLDDGVVSELGRAGVIVDSIAIGGVGERLLREIAVQARGGGGYIRVVGHASSRTRDLRLVEHNLINFGISLDRAQSVANHLMRQGVPPARIIVEARGDTDPIFFETMPEGEAENRRVEIFLDF
ncbi:MAG: VWA domain-containing protein [Proteobacteria bacterium]|nr:VWA domain-containing protein [Pseudomonadota bacterium]